MAIDIIKPLKFESNEGDIGPTETQPNEDYITAKGFSIKELEDILIDSDESGNLIFTDQVSGGPYTLAQLLSSGITENEHRGLYTLVHLLAFSNYQDITYDGWKINNMICWTNSGKTKKMREMVIAYTGWKINSLVVKQYNTAGVLSETLTGIFIWSGWKITSITWALT